MGDNVIQRGKNSHHRKRVNDKTRARYPYPFAAAVRSKRFCLCGAEIGESAKQCRNEGKDYKKMAQLPGSKMFAYELSVQWCVFMVKYLLSKIKAWRVSRFGVLIKLV